MNVESSLPRIVTVIEKTEWATCQRLQEASLRVLESLEARLLTISNAVE